MFSKSHINTQNMDTHLIDACSICLDGKSFFFFFGFPMFVTIREKKKKVKEKLYLVNIKNKAYFLEIVFH